MKNSNEAKKCFAENINNFAHPRAMPEKFNLYQGLYNISQSLEGMESQLRQMDQRLLRLEQALNARVKPGRRVVASRKGL